MRRSFKTYLIIWIAAVLLFNAVIFLIPSSMDGRTIVEVAKLTGCLKGSSIDIFGISSQDIVNAIKVIPEIANNNGLELNLTNFANYLLKANNGMLILDKYGGAFWPSYVCVMLAFVGQLIVSICVFKEINSQKFFYKIPLIQISYTGLIITLIFGVIGMFVPFFPSWLAIAIVIFIFVITLISLLKANLVSEVISTKDDEIKQNTAFMKKLTNRAKALYDANRDNDDLKKLYEAFRYANPMLNDEEFKTLLSQVEYSKDKELINKLIAKLK